MRREQLSKLTLKQWRLYSAWYSGMTQQQIADRYAMRQSRVAEVIGRARKTCPWLPLPPRVGHRKTTQVSQFANSDGVSPFAPLGLN